jgi:hypothetical protein
MYKGTFPDLESSQSLPWQRVYAAVLSETDLLNLFVLVEIAEATLLSRRELLGHAPDTLAERQAIQGALHNLVLIKKERLKFMNEDS